MLWVTPWAGTSRERARALRNRETEPRKHKGRLEREPDRGGPCVLTKELGLPCAGLREPWEGSGLWVLG